MYIHLHCNRQLAVTPGYRSKCSSTCCVSDWSNLSHCRKSVRYHKKFDLVHQTLLLVRGWDLETRLLNCVFNLHLRHSYTLAYTRNKFTLLLCPSFHDQVLFWGAVCQIASQTNQHSPDAKALIFSFCFTCTQCGWAGITITYLSIAWKNMMPVGSALLIRHCRGALLDVVQQRESDTFVSIIFIALLRQVCLYIVSKRKYK